MISDRYQDWDALYEIVRKRGLKKLINSLKKAYPESVVKAVAAALTVAQMRLERIGWEVSPNKVAMCYFVNSNCHTCSFSGGSFYSCGAPYETAGETHIQFTEKVYKDLRKKVPKQYLT